jgi:hypothetical protein
LIRSSIRRVLLLLPMVSACATVESGGFRVSADGLEQASAEILPRAAFAFGCDSGAIKLVVLATDPAIWPHPPTQIGASGCGHRGTFVLRRHPVEWVLAPVPDTRQQH